MIILLKTTEYRGASATQTTIPVIIPAGTRKCARNFVSILILSFSADCRIKLMASDSGLPSVSFHPPYDWEPIPTDGPVRVEIDKSSVSFDQLCRNGMHVYCTVITNGNGITRIRLTA